MTNKSINSNLKLPKVATNLSWDAFLLTAIWGIVNQQKKASSIIYMYLADFAFFLFVKFLGETSGLLSISLFIFAIILILATIFIKFRALLYGNRWIYKSQSEHPNFDIKIFSKNINLWNKAGFVALLIDLITMVMSDSPL